MNIDRLNGYTLVAKTNFPFLSYVFFVATIACGVGFLSLRDIEPKSLCGLGAVVFAMITALITRRSEAVFDSRKKEIKISSGTFSMKTLDPIAFEKVKGVKIERSTFSGKPFGRVVLVLDDIVVPLSPGMKPFSQQLEKDAKQLIRFIGCQEPLSSYDLTDGMPKSVPKVGAGFSFDDVDKEVIELVSKKRLIEAIKLYRSKTGLGLKESKDVIDEIQRRMKSGLM